MNRIPESGTIEEDRVLQEQTISLYRGLPATAAATILASIMTAAMMLPVVKRPALVSWVSALLFISISRGVLYIFYTRSAPIQSANQYRYWFRAFYLGTLLSALVWGSAGILFFIPGNTAYQAILCFVLGGMASGAVTSLSYRKLAVYTFQLAVTLPLIVNLALENRGESLTLAAMTLLILAFTSLSSLQFFRSTRASIILRLEAARDRKELSAARQKLDLHIGNTPLGFIEWDRQFHVIEWNDSAEKIFGYTKAEALGRHAAGLIVPLDMKALVDEVWNSLIAQRGGKRSDNENITRAGNRIQCEWYNTPLIGSGGKVIGVASLVNDVTQQHRTTQELRKARNEAEKASLAKSEFLSRMSHELRTPLNAILGFGQLLQIDLDKMRSDQKEQIDHIVGAGEHLLELINEVLDLVRIDSGQMELTEEEFDISNCLESIIAFLKPLADKTEIRINSRLEKDVLILTDRLRLKQILINIVSNAIKYNREGGSIDVHLQKIPASSSESVRVEIADTGPGIKVEDQERIFEPFTRIMNNGAAIPHGTGIGLAITKQMVQLLGGRVGVESVVGEGSLFWIELPLIPRANQPQVNLQRRFS